MAGKFISKITLTNDKVCQSCSDTLTLCGNTFISNVGRIAYTTDQSNTYTIRSLVDKGYVTGLTSTSITSAGNGLTKSSQSVRLGGALTGNTSITGAYTLGFSNSIVNIDTTNCLNISGAIKVLTTPATGTVGDSSVMWNSTDKCFKVITIPAMLSCAITGATNGLTKTNQIVCLGGGLTQPTAICGVQTLKLGDLNGITLSTQNITNIGLNAKSSGGIYIKSQSGVVDNVNDFCNAIGLAADYDSAGGFALYDNRIGANQTGIVYAANYSLNYVNRSLVDKAYVDSVATGLLPHAAVSVATTTNLASLSGLLTIDGITLTNGMRVLVKNQITGWRNGIYSATTGTWGRTSDYDFVPSPEIANGDLIPVTSGNTQGNSIWILTTPNPVISGITSLNYSEFSQLMSVTAGNGICVATVGTNKQIAVLLSPTTSGLCFDGTGLELDRSVFGTGMCINGSCNAELRISKCVATGNQIPIAINTGGTNTLYVDSCTVSSCLGIPISTANNGLNKIGCNIRLGGALTGNTSITGAYTLGFNNAYINITGSSGVNISGAIRALTTPATGINTDGILVWNSTDKCIKQIALPTALSCAITGATNGLTKTSQVVCLGGALIGNTGISGAYTLGFNNTYVNITGSSGVNISGAIRALSTPATGSVTDSNVMWNSTDKCFKIVTVPSLLSCTITGATNGLTKSGQNVCLGGALVANTSITGAYTLGFNNTIINITGSSGVYISGAIKALSTPATGASTDSVLVWNSTDKCIKTIVNSTIGSVYSISGITTNKTLTCNEQVVLVNTTSNGVIITLPVAGTVPVGKFYYIKNTSCGYTNYVTIDSGVGSLIDDSRCATISTDYGGFQLVLACTISSCSFWYALNYIG